MNSGIRPCPKGVKPGRIKPKRLKDPAHLMLIRQLPCLVCGTTHGIEVHHLLRGTVRGWGLKAKDSEVLPLCFIHHTQSDDCAHDNKCGGETEWFKSKGIINPLYIARKLYENTGDYGKMLSIINTARE
ncbi:MAG: DUF968 domain-containing protein [Candidatus Omnitrophica bacterium]|nr:DUF968 domain-containing protein [Candidatus Omnitrophota bacterium]